MAKTTSQDPLANTVRSLIRENEDDLVVRITKALRSEISDRVQIALGGKVAKKPAPQRIKKCLRPGCKKNNRGPRFRYLCVDHENTPQATVDKWRVAAGFQPEPRKKANSRAVHASQ